MFWATLLLRGYGLFTALIFGTFDADSMAVFSCMLLIGIIVDILRNLYSPEVRETPRGFSKLAERAHNDPSIIPNYKLQIRFNVALYGAGILYILAFMALGPQKEADAVPWIVRALLPFQNFTAHISSISRRIDSDLLAHGMPNRALESGHIYMVGTWLFVINLLMWLSFTGHRFYFKCILLRYTKPPTTQTAPTIRKSITIMVVLWSMYVLYNNVMDVDWAYSSPLYGYHNFKNNLSFIVYIVGLNVTYLIGLCSSIYSIVYNWCCVKTYQSIQLDSILSSSTTSEV
jgi:hypothetical protein